MLKALFVFVSTFLFAINSGLTEVGSVRQRTGSDSFLIRAGKKMMITDKQMLESGDEVHSKKSSLLLYIYPATQVYVSSNSQLKINPGLFEAPQFDKTNSVIALQAGRINAKIVQNIAETSDQRIEIKDTIFTGRAGEFQLVGSQDIKLDVFEGVVEVSSPLIQSFVPEMVKANQGLTLSRNKKMIRRKMDRKLHMKFSFLSDEDIKKEWQTVNLKKKK